MVLTKPNGHAVKHDEMHDLLPDLPYVLVREQDADGNQITLKVRVPPLKTRTIMYLKKVIETTATDFITSLNDGESDEHYINKIIGVVRQLDTIALYELVAMIIDKPVEWVERYDEFRWMRQVFEIVLREEDLMDTFRAAFTTIQPWLTDYIGRSSARSAELAEEPGAVRVDVPSAASDLPLHGPADPGSDMAAGAADGPPN